MQAIEFETHTHNGAIELPARFRPWTDQIVRVIVLINKTDIPVATTPTPNLSVKPTTERPLGLLKGQLKARFAEDFNMTEEELLRS
jgi:hypothetical protein